jgi:hypothetical protein
VLLPKGLFGESRIGIQVLRISEHNVKIACSEPISKKRLETLVTYFTEHIIEYLVENASHIGTELIDNKRELNWHMKIINCTAMSKW